MIVGDHPSNMQLQVAPLVKFPPKRHTKNGWNTDSPNRTIKGCKSHKAFQTSSKCLWNYFAPCLSLQILWDLFPLNLLWQKLTQKMGPASEMQSRLRIASIHIWIGHKQGLNDGSLAPQSSFYHGHLTVGVWKIYVYPWHQGRVQETPKKYMFEWIAKKYSIGSSIVPTGFIRMILQRVFPGLYFTSVNNIQSPIQQPDMLLSNKESPRLTLWRVSL